MQDKISISLVGDILITKRIPQKIPTRLKEIAKILNQHDIRFGNLETTIRENEGWPEVFPGGGYAMANPRCVTDLKNLGFTVFNTANNHSMDYGHGALISTIENLDKEDILHCGTGRNLNDASKAVFSETEYGRVAFLGVVSTFHASYAAGPQNQEMIGRPGVSPLRHKAIYHLNEKNFSDLSRIASDIGINDYMNQAIKEGYAPKSENLKFGTFEFKMDDCNYVETTPLFDDVDRTSKIIRDAKIQSDIVVVSIHSHQFKGKHKTTPTDFCRIFSQKCIDAGADVVVCHGPHILRGIEQYKKGVIFHGLGNFVFQHETMTALPEEYYQKYGTTRQTSSGVGDLMNRRSKGGTIGLISDDKAWESILVSLDCTKETIDVKLYPIEISRGVAGGLPYLSKNIRILQDLQALSLDYETNFEIDEDKKIGLMGIKR